DIIFITEDRPHEIFKRNGSDLLMNVNIFLREALIGTVLTVNTIDERILRVPITNIITGNYKKIVSNEGMPMSENPKERGSLLITFSIEFPIYLTIASKKYLQKAFKTLKANGESDNHNSKFNLENINQLILNDKIHRDINDV
ncbi:dnaJ homolog subfamily B member 1-like, partial [Cephus cinctus]|uniref:DnaJ homolog subfamily B member 1-like n=1 Tax=Cephus cinctus TaxID=211228 RepID=A0AAJ7VY72_CEPCN